MAIQKYSVNQHLIETLLSRVKPGEIAISEILRGNHDNYRYHY